MRCSIHATAGQPTYRQLSSADEQTLKALDAACKRADGDEWISHRVRGALEAAAQDPADTLGAAFPGREGLAAAAWIQAGRAGRVVIHGRVHPDCRRLGLGTRLLAWAEGRARERLPAGSPMTLVITDEALTPGAARLYARTGYRSVLAEDMLVFDLRQPAPDRHLPPGVSVEPWTEANASDFFAAYRASFADRPGFPDPRPEDWLAEYAADEDFRPALSRLVRAGGVPVAYLTAGISGGMGWIDQMGVVPAWRRRGLASALLAGALRDFRAGGLNEAGLHVATNNPAAVRAYQKLGFIKRLQRARFVKPVDWSAP